MKEIKLSRGLVTMVDDEDFEKFSKFKWHANKSGRGYYAARNVGRFPHRTLQLLHREILGAPQGLETDHVNGDGLDNRRVNLRLCTRLENHRNQQRLRLGKSSLFKGVYWHKSYLKWCARIQFDRHSIFLGRFTDETEAAQAYDTAARKLFGNFAAPNFN